MIEQKTSKRQVVLILALLILLVLIAFEPVRHNDFIDYDDPAYITENPNIQSGITAKSAAWAFTAGYQSNWHPLTWLSHMLDIELFGLNPLGHHLHNVALHTASTVLLFLILLNMTGALWPSVFAAMAFGIHPLRVESVAWASERKDTLSMLFFMLTAAAYIYYARKGGILRYGLVVLCFGLGLMAKPMLVTVPLILLILDWWPLNRIQYPAAKLPRLLSVPGTACPAVPPGRLIAEKIPLLVLTLIFCIITYNVQQAGGSMVAVKFLIRALNVLTSCLGYLGKMVWPADLAVLYPYPLHIYPLWPKIVSFIILTLGSVFIFYSIPKRPYLMAGWLWYVVTLIPVIGLVQVGIQSMADRYTYLPSVGIFIALSWTAAHLSAKWRYQKMLMGIVGGLAVIAMIMATRTQLTYWKDSISLYEHTLAVTQDNYAIHNNLSWTLARQNKLTEAQDHIKAALQIWPGCPDANINTAAILIQRGQLDKATEHLQKALEAETNNAMIYLNMGYIFEARKNAEEAICAYERATQLNRNEYKAFTSLGILKARQGHLDQAVKCFRQSLRNNPAYVKFCRNPVFDPHADTDLIAAMNNLAWILATTQDNTIRNPDEAVSLAQKVCQLTGFKKNNLLDTLAAAYASANQFKEAAETAQQAIDSANAAGQKSMAEDITKRLRLYQTLKPYYETQPQN
jgi:Tfp pilus assembly protein PilF